MTKYFVIMSFRASCSSVKNMKGTSLSVEMLQGYMLICRNAEGVHGKKKVGNPWFKRRQTRHLPRAPLCNCNM